MLEQIDGYNVLGQLFIEKINFEQYIVDSTENSAMEKYPVKLYGEELNKEGNFCIAGHNYEEIEATLWEAKKSNKLTAIIANTIKGKGVSFMENNASWHGKAPNDEQLALALEELNAN